MSGERAGRAGTARVRLRGVSHRFGDGPPLFAPVTADLAAARRYALLGPSGSGKSTLLGLLAGELRPAIGAIERDPSLSVAWVFQSPLGSPRRTALDHVALPLMARGASRQAAGRRAMRLLHRFGLLALARTAFRHLSGGEAQRLMLARAVAGEPDLLLVDEPTAQLDQRAAERVHDALEETTLRGGVVVVATHDPRTADRCHERIVLGA